MTGHGQCCSIMLMGRCLVLINLMQIHRHICVKIESQGHWINIKEQREKIHFSPDVYFSMLWPSEGKG